ncbi:MAG TPA: hypothetical protein DHV62_04960 [Elusimicrobia bacterium]|nr:hypothetical protein [Elusimicrobiota bacterium]
MESAPAKKVEKTKVTPTKKVEEPLKKEISEGTTKQMKIDEKSGKSTSVDQYVKVRVKDGDQEVEMVLDPTYTDMAFEFQGKKRPTELKIEPETVEEVLPPTKSDIQVKKSIEKIMKKIDELSYDIAELKSEKGPLLAVPPSEKGVPVPPSEPKKAELPELPKDVTEDVLVSIHQAQKLFYAGKHQDALREVRKSLSKKETALGYALLGSIYFTMGDLDSALSSWDVALEIDPLMTEVSEILEKYKR